MPSTWSKYSKLHWYQHAEDSARTPRSHYHTNQNQAENQQYLHSAFFQKSETPVCPAVTPRHSPEKYNPEMVFPSKKCTPPPKNSCCPPNISSPNQASQDPPHRILSPWTTPDFPFGKESLFPTAAPTEGAIFSGPSKNEALRSDAAAPSALTLPLTLLPQPF